MTKTVRIENACTAPYQLQVRPQQLNATTGEWEDVPGQAPRLLGHPTALTEVTVWKERRLIVEEVPAQEFAA